MTPKIQLKSTWRIKKSSHPLSSSMIPTNILYAPPVSVISPVTK